MRGPQLNISFEATPEGCEQAIAKLDQIKSALASNATPTPAPAPTKQSTTNTAQTSSKQVAHAENPAVKLLRAMADEKGSRSPRFLKALTTEHQALEDLAPSCRMPGEKSDPSPASMRAIFRNIRRTEKWMVEHGELDALVIQVDDSRYEVEGYCRYYLSPADYQALSQL